MTPTRVANFSRVLARQSSDDTDPGLWMALSESGNQRARRNRLTVNAYTRRWIAGDVGVARNRRTILPENFIVEGRGGCGGVVVNG